MEISRYAGNVFDKDVSEVKIFPERTSAEILLYARFLRKDKAQNISCESLKEM